MNARSYLERHGVESKIQEAVANVLKERPADAIAAIAAYLKNPGMEQRVAGSSGLKLSTLGLGAWQFGSAGTDDYWGLEFTQELATELIDAAAGLGVTYIDTAEDYAKGGSEKQVGCAHAALSAERRDPLVIGSKILPNHCGEVRQWLEGTLSRLGRPCVDLYMVHWPIDANSMAHFSGAHTASGGRDYSTTGAVDDVPPTQRAFAELVQLQAEGKIKHIGVSNFGVAQLTEALSVPGVRIAVNQLCYNLIFRAAEMEILPFCAARGIGVLAYSPLMQGLLTDKKWTNADDVPTYRARTRHFDGTRPKSRHGEGGHEALLFATLAKLRAIAAEAQIAMADLAIAWPLANLAVTTVIAGATRREQLEQNARAVGLKLDGALLAKLDEATAELKQAMGPNCDLWQGKKEGTDTGRIK